MLHVVFSLFSFADVLSGRPLMEPCYHGYVLAPTTNQRMRYVRWLYVHAKKQVMVSERMKFMWNEYQVGTYISIYRCQCSVQNTECTPKNDSDGGITVRLGAILQH